jgi:hypothetical protein
MHPMFVRLFIETDTDDLLTEEQDRKRLARPGTQISPGASALTSAPSAASSSRSCPFGSARPTLPSWRCQESSRCAPRPGDVSILTQVVAKNIRDLHRITRSILAVDGVARSTAICLTRSSHASRTPCSASPPAPGADPYDPSPGPEQPALSL